MLRAMAYEYFCQKLTERVCILPPEIALYFFYVDFFCCVMYTKIQNEINGAFKMGVVLFAVFAAIEILLTVLSCTKYRSLWYRNRVLFSGAELILLLLTILLPVTGQKWRFTDCVIILGIRLVVSGITYLVKRKGAAKEKTNAKVIAGTVLNFKHRVYGAYAVLYGIINLSVVVSAG